jgi:hypothetical protein
MLMQDFSIHSSGKRYRVAKSQSDIELLDGLRMVENGMCRGPGWSEQLSSRGMAMWDMAGSHRTLVIVNLGPAEEAVCAPPSRIRSP